MNIPVRKILNYPKVYRYFCNSVAKITRMNFPEMLKSYNLSLTRSRLRLLEILDGASIPLSERDIELRMGMTCNRTTVYRNLTTLVGKGIAQRILSDDSVKYKILHGGDGSSRKHDHVHFQCRSCNRVLCLEDLMVKDYILPEGFSKIENQFLIVGICKDCNYVGKN